MATSTPCPTPATLGTGVPLAATVAVIAAVAVNLRPGIATVGPELDTVTAHFGAGARAAGAITALPVIAFALVSLATPFLLARITLRTGLYSALTLIGVSLAVRPWSGLQVFVLTTFTAAIGVGLITVLLPAIIRASGNTRVLVVTFTTALQAGAAIGFATVVPLSRMLNSWQWALAIWAALAPIGILALWGARWAPTGTAEVPRTMANPFAILRRTRSFGLAVFFGLQALVAFVIMGWLPSVLHDADVSPEAAGAYLGVLTCVGVPVSLVVPPIVAKSRHAGRWLAGFSLCSAAGIFGFLVAPAAAPLLWSLVLGVGLSVFSLALTVITVRADTPEQVILLSSAVQGVGYVIAALGPYAIGLFRQVGHGWTIPLIALIATALVQAAIAGAAGRNRSPSSSTGKRTAGADS